MKKGVAIGGLILVTVIWGGGFVASDMALESMKPFQIMMVRFLLASVLMGLVSMGQRKKEAKIENRAGAIKAGMLMGLTLFAGFALQIVGLQYTTPSKNAFLTALNVVIVPFIAFVILKKKVGVKGIIGAIMAVAGVALLSLNGNLTLGIGDLLSLFCAVGFAFQIFLTGEFVKKYPAARFESHSDVYRICTFHDQLVCIRRDRFSGYDQGMAQRLISRCDQYDHLLSASDSMSEVRRRNKSSHHTLYGVRIWNGVFHYHSA